MKHLSLTALVWCGMVGLACGQWPQWRGPGRDGISSEKISLAAAWPSAGPNILWRQEVATGFSSMSVDEGRVYTMGNSNAQDFLWCLDATDGRVLWKFGWSARLDPQYYEGGPSCTPTIEEGKVYAINKWGTVVCLEAKSGGVVWRHDLWQEGIRSNRWGFAGSPLIYKDLVLLNASEAGVALERTNGKMVWHHGTGVAGYAAPTLFHSGDKDVLLIFAAEHLVAVDPMTGRELWRYPFKTNYDTNITDPICCDDHRILISSFSRGCALLDIVSGEPTLIYANRNLFNHLSPGLKFGEYLLAFSGEAKFTTDLRCLHWPSGEVKWTRKDPKFGSMIYADGKVILLSETGELLLARFAPEELTITSRAKILDPVCWTPPALARGRLYARNARGTMVCVELTAPR